MFAKIHARTTRKKTEARYWRPTATVTADPTVGCILMHKFLIFHECKFSFFFLLSSKCRKKFNISWCVNTFAKHRKKQLLEMFWLLN